jgi:uncharacterized protein (TIGR03790 family)
LCRGLGVAILLLGSAARVGAQSGAHVAVVINTASQASVEIGEYYARKRDVPASNVIRITAPVDETVTRGVYQTSIEAAIANALNDAGLQDRVLYIVLTKDVPLRITGRSGARGDAGSVDSELTLLYRRMTGRDVLLTGTVDNPYYAGARPISGVRRFSHRDQDIYLVTRLDGFTVQDALSLVDRALTPSTEGRVLLDRRSGATGMAELWLVEAASRLRELGHDTADIVEALPREGSTASLLGYFSWGSNDPANRRRRTGLRFGAGAIAATLAGLDARTFLTPPETWQPGGSIADRANIFAQATQSLTADLIRDGVTGAAGNVAEPLLSSAIRPQVLFPAYFSGFNLAESFYLALPHLSWQSVVLGDPLCRPFAGGSLPDEGSDDALDPSTGLPRYFSARRIDVVGERNPGAPREVLPLIVRVEEAIRTGRTAEARSTLQRVTELAPNLAEQHMRLALLDEEVGDGEAAIRRYRRVLELQPANAAALNNLAYRLATDEKQLSEALLLARRSALLAPQDPRALDTLGWIHHLLGHSGEAVRVLSDAARRAPGNPEIRLHTAIALAVVGSYAAAEAHLKEALRLSPDLESREDVQQLRGKLGKKR